MDFGAFRVIAGFQGPMNPRADGACLCLAVNDSECWIVGNACQVTLTSGDADKPNLDLLLVEEGSFENGKWQPGRRLNGDETSFMHMGKPSVWHVKFFTYE